MNTTERETTLWVDDEYELLTESRDWMDVPERRLLFAILERAVRDCLGNQGEDSEQATDWLFCDVDDDPHTPFSFQWICENLEVDQNEFRSKILKTARQSKSSRPSANISMCWSHQTNGTPCRCAA